LLLVTGVLLHVITGWADSEERITAALEGDCEGYREKALGVCSQGHPLCGLLSGSRVLASQPKSGGSSSPSDKGCKEMYKVLLSVMHIVCEASLQIVHRMRIGF
jgi:hypothetical protein